MLLREAADAGIPVLRGIGDDRLDDPTPCAEFRVRDLINHLYQVVVNFQAAARRERSDFSSTPEVVTATDWRDGFAEETAKLVDAWTDPTALDGVSPGMGLKQAVVGQMALLDLTLHPWDLARATGQAFVPSAAAVADLHAMVDEMGPTARQMKVFGSQLTPRPDADEFDRLLAKTGRDPMWTVAAGT